MDGIAREREVASYYRGRGYLVASRRHEPGAGDLIAIPSAILQRADNPEWSTLSGLLVEVKATRRPFERFGPDDRRALLELALEYGLEAMLAHWPAHGSLELMGPGDWPHGEEERGDWAMPEWGRAGT